MMESAGEEFRTRQDVRRRLRKHAILPGDFKLKCGKPTTVMVDCATAFRDTTGMFMLGRFLRQYMPVTATHVGGPRSGADVLAASLVAFSDGTLSWLTVREEPKGRGIHSGAVVAQPFGRDVWLLEDVVTTGNSVLDAAKHLANEDFNILSVFALVDRGDGAAEAIRTAGYKYQFGFDLADLMADV